MFIWEFHIYVHICNLVLDWNQNLTFNSPDYTFLLVIQFFLPIFSSILFVQHACQEHQMTGGADCSVAGGTEYFVTGVAACFGAGGHWVIWNWWCWVFCGHIFSCFLWISPCQSSSCFSSFLQMGQCGPHEHFSVTCFGVTITQGIAAIWVGASVFTVGAGVGAGVGGIGQLFLVSNKFSEADPVLGQGVPCLTGALGISSSGGGLGVLGWGMSFVLGLGCWVRNFHRLSCCQFIYCYWYECCCGPCHWHLGGGSGYCGGRCSWDCGCRCRLGKDSHLVPSFGNYGLLPFVTCLEYWGLSNHGVGALLGWTQLGL